MEMTPEQKALKYWHLFVAEKGHDPMPFEFATFCLEKRDILPEVEGEQWQTLNYRLLVNFLHLPEEHQVHLLESMFVKRPKLKELLKP